MADGWGRRPTRLTALWPGPQPGATWEERLKAPLDKLWVAWADWLGCLPWKFMVSLTFDPKKRFPVSRERASEETWQWFQMLSWAYTGRPTWLYSVERGRSGLWHAHGLVTDLDEEICDLLRLWLTRNGSAEPTPISGTRSATLYVTKDTPYYSEVVLAPNIDKFKESFGQGPPVVTVADGPCQCS